MDFVIVALFVSVLSIGFYWHRRRVEHYRNFYEATLSDDALTKHFDHITKHANDMVYLMDARTHIIEVNEKASTLLGYSHEEFLEMSAMDLRPIELKLDVNDFIKKVTSGDGIVYETEQIKKDGSRIPVEVSARSFYIAGKQYFQAIDRDITERKLLEKALRIEEKRYRELFEKNPNPMWIYDPKTLAFIEVNNSSVNHYGYSRDEFLSMSLLNLYPDEDQSKLLENILSDNEETAISKTWRHKKKDGTIIFVELISNEISTFDGKKTKLTLINDITEKKIAQDSLNTERAQLLSIFGSIDEAIYVSDMDTYEILYTNDATIKRFGIHPLGEKCYNVLHGRTKPCTFCTNKIIKEMNYRPYFWEFYNPEVNRSFQIIDRVIKWTDGRDVRFELAVDITAKKESEQILRESEERYRALVNNLPDFVFVIVNEKIVYINSIAAEKSGYSLKDLNGKSIFDFADPKYHPILIEQITQHRLHNKMDDFEIEIFFKSGESRKVIVKAVPITYNKAAAILVVLTDITERKKAEEKLELLAQAVRSISEGISITDMNSNLLYVNEAFIKIYGFEEKELIGQKISIVRPTNLPDTSLEIIELATIAGGWTGEQINKKKDGTVFPILLTTSSVLNEKGNPYALVGIARDITESRQIQNALEESEKRYRNIFEYSPIGIYRTNPGGEILLANPALVNMLGFPSVEELKKINLTNYKYTDDNPSKNFIEQIENDGKVIGYETAWYRYDGSIIFVRENAKVVYGNNGEILYYEGTVEDITEQKAIEEELQKHRLHLQDLVDDRTSELKTSEEKFRALAENTHDILFRINSNLEYVYVNPIFGKFSGIPPASILGKTIKEIGMPSQVVVELEAALQKAFETKKMNRYEMQLPDQRWFDWSIIPEFDPDGNVVTIILNGRDITERINMEVSIKNALDNEKVLNELKTKFISTASHEFRTPLTTILSSTELLERYGRNWELNKYNEHISNIKISVDYLTQLINDVLTLGKTEIGKMELDLKQIDFYEFCLFVIKEINSLITNKHKLSFKYLTEQKYFYLDEKLLRFILVNLLANSIKYSPNGGMIELEADYIANQLRIKISDEGIGISKEDQKVLFEPFHRGSNINNIPGTGLGLSIVKRSIELFKGRIEIDSKINCGAAFTIFIPAEIDYSNRIS